MSKQRSAWADYLTYLLVRFVVCLVQALPSTLAQNFAGMLAWVLYTLDKRHRKVCLENLTYAFPGALDEAQRGQVTRAVYEHFCLMLIDMLHMERKVHLQNWKDRFEIDNIKTFVGVLLDDRPLMIVTGHYGNWEISGYLLGLLGFRTHAVARPLDNPYVDQYLRSIRERTGQRILDKKGDFDEMQALLDSGGILATLADQDAGKRGLYVHFFHRPASTHKAVALMAIQYSVPILVALTTRRGYLNYRTHTEKLLLPESYASQPDAVKRMTQDFTTALENGVRKQPAQYFWLHRRWKHQPAAKSAKNATMEKDKEAAATS